MGKQNQTAHHRCQGSCDKSRFMMHTPVQGLLVIHIQPVEETICQRTRLLKLFF